MTSRQLVRATVMLLLAVASPESEGAAADDQEKFQSTAALGEKQKIEALILQVEGLTDAKFIRNGKSYDAGSAASFLRGKWQAQGDKIQTAADFIEKAGSVSGTTGKPYLIQKKDGTQIPCGDFLKAELKKLEGGKR